MATKIFNLLRGKMSFIYVFITFDLLYRCKVGITRTQTVDERRTGVEASLSNSLRRNIKLRWAIYAPMLLNERAEKWLHRVLSPFRYTGLKPEVSGYSEWFWFFNPITACVFTYYGIEYGVFDDGEGINAYTAWWLVWCFLPLPIDIMVGIIICALLEYSLLIVVFGGIAMAVLKMVPNV